MAFEEVAIICFSFVSCVALVAFAYFKSEERKENLRQQGITQRATMKLGQPGDATSPTGEWWVPLASKLLEIPAIQQILTEKLTQVMVKKD